MRLEVLLVSPALRARETALIVAAQLDFNRELRYDELLYRDDAASLLQAVRRCEPSAATVLLVGHNPGISALARQLGGAADTLAALELRTAGLCRLQLEADGWDELEPRQVTAVSLLR